MSETDEAVKVIPYEMENVDELIIISNKEMSEIFPLELKLIAAKSFERETLVLMVKFFIVMFLISVSLATKIP